MLNSWQQIQGTDKALPVQLQKKQSPAQSGELWVSWVLPGDWDGEKERVKRSWKDGTWNVFGSGTGSTSQHCRHPRVGAPITPEQQPQNHSEVSKERNKIKQPQRQQPSSK